MELIPISWKKNQHKNGVVQGWEESLDTAAILSPFERSAAFRLKDASTLANRPQRIAVTHVLVRITNVFVRTLGTSTCPTRQTHPQWFNSRRESVPIPERCNGSMRCRSLCLQVQAISRPHIRVSCPSAKRKDPHVTDRQHRALLQS